MRWVIAICLMTGFIVWDAGYNDSHYIDMGLRMFRQFLNYFGAGV